MYFDYREPVEAIQFSIKEIELAVKFLDGYDHRCIWIRKNQIVGSGPSEWREIGLPADGLFIVDLQAIVHEGDYLVKTIFGLKVLGPKEFEQHFAPIG